MRILAYIPMAVFVAFLFLFWLSTDAKATGFVLNGTCYSDGQSALVAFNAQSFAQYYNMPPPMCSVALVSSSIDASGLVYFVTQSYERVSRWCYASWGGISGRVAHTQQLATCGTKPFGNHSRKRRLGRRL